MPIAVISVGEFYILMSPKNRYYYRCPLDYGAVFLSSNPEDATRFDSLEQAVSMLEAYNEYSNKYYLEEDLKEINKPMLEVYRINIEYKLSQ